MKEPFGVRFLRFTCGSVLCGFGCCVSGSAVPGRFHECSMDVLKFRPLEDSSRPALQAVFTRIYVTRLRTKHVRTDTLSGQTLSKHIPLWT